MTVNSVNTYIVPTTNREVTMPSQPCFGAWLDTTVTNVTGDGTEYTIIFDTERFDQNSDFNLGTSTFTAPVTGKYRFNVCYNITFDGSTPTSAISRLKASNRTYRYLNSSNNTESRLKGHRGSIIVDMDATDTITTSVDYGGSGKTIDVLGDDGGNARTFFSGHLLT